MYFKNNNVIKLTNKQKLNMIIIYFFYFTQTYTHMYKQEKVHTLSHIIIIIIFVQHTIQEILNILF